MIYLYAVTETPAEAPGCAGLEDEPLRILSACELAGIYSDHDRDTFDPEPDALWRHDHVVEAAMARGAVLPARFGTTFADTAGLAAALERDQARLHHRLEQVRGCVELAVRLSLPGPGGSAPQDGRDYLRMQLVRRQERRTAIEQTLHPLEAHAVSWHSSPLAADTGTVTASYLVRAGDLDRFADEVRGLADRHSELSLSCTGPWPPYSFVGEDG